MHWRLVPVKHAAGQPKLVHPHKKTLVRRILCVAAINILSNPPALLRKAGRGGSIDFAVLHSNAGSIITLGGLLVHNQQSH